MAEITLRLRHDPRTGRRELVVHLESDDDVLGHEHERDHRALVESLIGQRLDDDIDVVVERVEKGGTASPAPEAPVPRAEGEKNRS
jgi:hypothetical protein